MAGIGIQGCFRIQLRGMGNINLAPRHLIWLNFEPGILCVFCASVVNRYALTQPQRRRGTEAIFPALTHPHYSAKSHKLPARSSILTFPRAERSLAVASAQASWPHPRALRSFRFLSERFRCLSWLWICLWALNP
jgi:hypothetical protein